MSKDAPFNRIMAVLQRGEGVVSRSDFVEMLKETSLADRADKLGDLFFNAIEKRSLDAAFDLVEAVFPGIHIHGAFCANRGMSSQSASIVWTDGVTAASGTSKALCPAHQVIEAFLDLIHNLWMKSPDTLREEIKPMTGRPIFAGRIGNKV